MAKAKRKMKEDIKGIKFTTPRAVLAFPELFTPKAFEGKGEPKYSSIFIFKKDQDLTVIKKAMRDAKVEAFGPDKANWPTFKSPIKDGEEMSQYEGFEDSVYFRASTNRKPVVIDRSKNRIEDSEEIYGGCEADAVIVCKVVEVSSNYFLVMYLQGVRKIRDGERFGSGINVDEDFEDLEDEDNYDEPVAGVVDDEDDDLDF